MTRLNRKPWIASGILMGIGLGGFVDGILFHQILQLHSMLSAKLSQDVLENVKISMVWDGLFHLLTWLCTVVALFMSWLALQIKNFTASGKDYLGGMLAGWGIFNLVEGIIDHHIIQIHHVIERMGLSVYDYLFLAFGALCVLSGILIVNKNDNV